MIRRLGEQPLEADIREIRARLSRSGLAQPGGWLPFAIYQAAPYGLTGNTNIYMVTVPRDCTVRTWAQAAKVNTTNDGSNYWVFKLLTLGGSLLIAEINTSAISPTTWEVVSDLAIDYAFDSSYHGIFLQAIKYGSPGPLYTGGPAVFVT